MPNFLRAIALSSSVKSKGVGDPRTLIVTSCAFGPPSVFCSFLAFFSDPSSPSLHFLRFLPSPFPFCFFSVAFSFSFAFSAGVAVDCARAHVCLRCLPLHASQFPSCACPRESGGLAGLAHVCLRCLPLHASQ